MDEQKWRYDGAPLAFAPSFEFSVREEEEEEKEPQSSGGVKLRPWKQLPDLQLDLRWNTYLPWEDLVFRVDSLGQVDYGEDTDSDTDSDEDEDGHKHDLRLLTVHRLRPPPAPFALHMFAAVSRKDSDTVVSDLDLLGERFPPTGLRCRHGVRLHDSSKSETTSKRMPLTSLTPESQTTNPRLFRYVRLVASSLTIMSVVISN